MRWPRAADKKRSTSPSSTVVAVPSFGSYRDCLARHRLDEALNLGLVVLGSHVGADERVQPARGQIEFARARRAGTLWRRKPILSPEFLLDGDLLEARSGCHPPE